MEKNKRSLEIKFKTYLEYSQEREIFRSKILIPNNGISVSNKTIPLSEKLIFAIRKEFNYEILGTKVTQNINQYENEMSFEIFGKNNQKIYDLIKKGYQIYNQLN